MGDESIDTFTAELIRRKARQLIGKAGITEHDAEDIAQDLHLDVWLRMKKHDPAKSEARHFIKQIVRHQISKCLRERLAKKRIVNVWAISLNETLDGGDGQPCERADLFADPRDPGGKAAERQARLAEAEGLLAPELRLLLDLLKTMSMTEAAAELRTDRANLYRRLRELRRIYGDCGFGPQDA